MNLNAKRKNAIINYTPKDFLEEFFQRSKMLNIFFF